MTDRTAAKKDERKARAVVFRPGLLQYLTGLWVLHSCLYLAFDDGEPYRAPWLPVALAVVAFFFSFFTGWKLNGTFLFLRGCGAKIPPEGAGEGEQPKSEVPVYDLRELVGTRRKFGSLELHFADGSKENLRYGGMFPWTKKKLKNELEAIIARNKAGGAESEGTS